MKTETVEAKAVRLLADHRVQIRFASEHIVSAAVRGDSSVYDVRWSRNQGWSCTCQCFGRCSHEEAVSSVTVRPVLSVIGS
jgi:hypothetical protein